MKVIDILHSTEWKDIEKEIGKGISEPSDEEKDRWKRFWSMLCKIEPKESRYIYYIKPTLYDMVMQCECPMPRSFVKTDVGCISYYSAGYIQRNIAVGMEIAEETLNEFTAGKICEMFIGTLFSLGFYESTAMKNWTRYYSNMDMVTE